jgi:glycosyltransferase involved in cell wall biosynthesis
VRRLEAGLNKALLALAQAKGNTPAAPPKALPVAEIPVKDSRPAVVVVSFIPPFPLEHGGNRQVIYALLKWLKKNGYYVYFIYQALRVDSGNRSKFSKDLVDELFVVGDYVKNPTSKFYSDQRKTFPETTELLHRLCKHNNILSVIVEYVNIAECLAGLPDDIVTMIHTHDMFSRIAMQRNPANISTDGLEMPRERERTLLLHAKVIVALQSNEAKLFKELVPEREVIVLGHTVPDLAGKTAANTDVVPGTILLVGGGNPVNRHGLSLFLKNAWPRILQKLPNCELRVVGSIGEVVPVGTKNVKVLGKLPKLADEYNHAALVINPILLGTGLKIKTVAALCHGKALVVTSSGAEGLQENTGKKAWLASDNWEQFADFCVNILEDEELRRKFEQGALDYAKQYLSEDVVFAELKQQLGKRSKKWIA